MKNILWKELSENSDIVDNKVYCNHPYITIDTWTILDKSLEPYCGEFKDSKIEVFDDFCEYFRNLIVGYLEECLERELLKESPLDSYHYIRADIEFKPSDSSTKNWCIIIPVIDIYNRARSEQLFNDSKESQQKEYIKTLVKVEIRKQVNLFMKESRDFEIY